MNLGLVRSYMGMGREHIRVFVGPVPKFVEGHGRLDEGFESLGCCGALGCCVMFLLPIAIGVMVC